MALHNEPQTMSYRIFCREHSVERRGYGSCLPHLILFAPGSKLQRQSGMGFGDDKRKHKNWDVDLDVSIRVETTWQDQKACQVARYRIKPYHDSEGASFCGGLVGALRIGSCPRWG